MNDLFSVPLGYIAPGEEDDGVSPSPVPAEAYEHRGKWLALHVGKILAVKDTRAELRKQFGDRHLGVTFFHVPPTPLVLR
jgi:hypothetical protein